MTPRDRRALLLGAGLIFGAWLSLRGVPGLVERWRARRHAVAQYEALLGETREAIAELPRMEDSAHAVSSALGHLASRLLTSETAPLALNELAGRVRLHAASSRVRVMSVTNAPDSMAVGGIARVTATIAVESDFQGIVGLLAGLGRDSTVIVVEHLSLTAQDPWADRGQPEVLAGELRLSAWYLRERRRP